LMMISFPMMIAEGQLIPPAKFYIRGVQNTSK
jgi:hypothetical protein